MKTKKLTLILTIFVLFLFFYYFINNLDSFKVLLHISLWKLFFIVILKSVSIFIIGQFVKVILQAFRLKVSNAQSFYISILSTIGNFLTPFRGGAGLRAIYLKRKFNLSYSYFLSTLSGSYIVTFLVTSFIALLSLIIINIRTGIYSIGIYCFFLSMFCITFFLSIYKIPKSIFSRRFHITLIDRFFKSLQKVIIGWNNISQNKILLVKLFTLSVISLVIAFLISYLEFNSIGLSIPIEHLILYICLSLASLLISLTPGSIGIKEGILFLSSGIIGITNEQVLQVAVIDRGIQFVVLIILSLLSTRIKRSETLK